MPESFQITIERAVFKATDSSFAVLQGTGLDGGLRTLCGELGSFSHGDRLEVEATLGNHPRFGPRWEVSDAVVLEPDDRASRKAFLESIEGIGPGRADQLLDLYGENVFDRIDAGPEVTFSELPGVGRKTSSKAASSWRERRQIRELVTLFHAARIEGGQAIAGRAARAFGVECVDHLTANPFVAASPGPDRASVCR